MENEVSAPQAAPMSDVDEFFSGMEDQADPVEPIVTPPVEQPKEVIDIDRLDALTREQRKIWQDRNALKAERAKVEQERQELEKLRSNPKELLNMKDPKAVDDIISRLFEEEKEDPTNDNKSLDQIYEEVEKRVLEKLEKQQKDKQSTEMVESEYREFVSGIKQHLETSGNYPLALGMGEAGLVAEVIEVQFRKDVETYGEEKAMEMMMSADQAAQRVEKHLAQEIDKVLESDKVRDYVLKKLGVATRSPSDNGNQLNHSQSNQNHLSLNNDDFRNPSNNVGVSEENLTDEEAFQRAISLIK